jgi:hypothetical protein
VDWRPLSKILDCQFSKLAHKGGGVVKRKSADGEFSRGTPLRDAVKDDRDNLWRKIDQCVRLRREFSDERLLRELGLMIEEARQRTEEIERSS